MFRPSSEQPPAHTTVTPTGRELSAHQRAGLVGGTVRESGWDETLPWMRQYAAGGPSRCGYSPPPRDASRQEDLTVDGPLERTLHQQCAPSRVSSRIPSPQLLGDASAQPSQRITQPPVDPPAQGSTTPERDITDEARAHGQPSMLPLHRRTTRPLSLHQARADAFLPNPMPRTTDTQNPPLRPRTEHTMDFANSFEPGHDNNDYDADYDDRGSLTPFNRQTETVSDQSTIRHRNPAHNKLCENVRKYLKSLQGSDPFAERNLANNEEVTHYALYKWDAAAKSGPPCCDLDAFRISLDAEPRCPWNTSAARVFTTAFIQRYKLPPSDAPVIERCFYQRIRSLKRAYSQRRETPEMTLRRERNARQEGRRTKVFHRRLYVFNNHPSLKPYYPEIHRLGVDGMSSDDSEYKGTPYFKPTRRSTAQLGQPIDLVVRKPLWRSESLTRLLHLVDNLYPIIRRIVTRDKRGGLPFARISWEEAKSTSGRFPRKLPINAYNSSWRSQQQDLIFIVAPLQHEYNYDHITHTLRALLLTINPRQTQTS
ncbi:hypothetical protein BJ165DRAFT_1523256 [Panaeolus papilionaceus]|nr:hypothetical protein BJ165DRAFT_1523256 [Panaeolus papilionaceus]